MAVERKGLSSSDQAVCARMGWAFLPRGWAVRAGVHNGAEPAGRGGERRWQAGGRRMAFKGLLWFDSLLRLTRMPGREG